MKVKEVANYLESLAPLSSQESYDNSGLIAGNPDVEITGVLVSLDCTEEIVQEAIDKKCNLIISHHPIVFKGLKRLTGKNYVERTVIKAIQNNICLYAIHTNLDNYQNGVNKKIGDLIGINKTEILSPANDVLQKLIVFTPKDAAESVKNAIFSAGGGNIGNYSECSFNSDGLGTYKGNENSNPAYGEKGSRHQEEEIKIEVLISNHISSQVVRSMLAAHPYEEVAYDLVPLNNQNKFEGSGMVGELEHPMDEKEFLALLKNTFKTGCIRHTALFNKPIKKVAWCGGSGSFLLKNAIRSEADIFITGDFKYHEFFDAEDKIIIADIGHYESEQFTIDLIADMIRKKFSTFALYLTEENTNPVNYY
ncbi:Nif3-like dinuclear metal center hexameric protein [Paracrocinitomix mangrovi]|uniref:Nif3-like dinuclear metal center hexameric protein n=1 Tax=Paracrocinitomix mangrovi TaxID=2862509 RepID=UPI001C8E4AF8|nr:Nif3-like dinuclear metal center hexameric protein [Paracrocinitomix mangrovi]UKN02643.1 Nif3-like dinuclear metal center hexameric protein [Paracrocinitomix mangrovi]